MKLNPELRRFVVHKRDSHDVYIGRPSKWGNPWTHKEGTKAKFVVDSREEAVKAFDEWVRKSPKKVETVKRELQGKVLGCWCSPKLCHGHVLAAIANNLELWVPDPTYADVIDWDD